MVCVFINLLCPVKLRYYSAEMEYNITLLLFPGLIEKRVTIDYLYISHCTVKRKYKSKMLQTGIFNIMQNG